MATMREMEDRMKEMEDKMKAMEAKVEEMRELLTKSGGRMVTEERKTLSTYQKCWYEGDDWFGEGPYDMVLHFNDERIPLDFGEDYHHLARKCHERSNRRVSDTSYLMFIAAAAIRETRRITRAIHVDTVKANASRKA